MDLLEGIFTRRSIRKYRDELIPEEYLNKMLKAAMAAPSANNCQPWHFLIINDRDKMEEIIKIHPYSLMLKEANVTLMVMGDTTLESGPGYWAVDCGAATENILLAAHGLGLGAVWLEIYPWSSRVNAFSKLFKLPEHIQPFALISVGYPAEEKEPSQRFKPEHVHRNSWENTAI